MQTWMAATDIVQPVATRETLGSALIHQHGAALALFNEHGTERALRLVSLLVQEQVVRTVGVNTGFTLQRISALTGGFNATTRKLDTASADLPSQVRVVTQPGDLTASGGVLRANYGGYQLNISRAIPYGPWMLHGGGSRTTSWHSGALLWGGDAAAQPIRLREGEGLAIRCNLAGGFTYPLSVQVEFNVGSGVGYCSESLVTIQAVNGVWAIFNGTGSGVVVDVGRLTVTEVADDSGDRTWSVETISGLDGGIPLAPTALDSRNKALPTGVRLVLNGAVTTAGNGAKLFKNGKNREGSDGPLRRLRLPYSGKHPTLPNLVTHACPGPIITEAISSPADAAMTLRGGEGIAILQRGNAAGAGAYHVQLTFAVEDALAVPTLSAPEVHLVS